MFVRIRVMKLSIAILIEILTRLDPANVTVWLRYVDAELKERNIMHARNLLDRAVTILPYAPPYSTSSCVY
jgi:hypothetical protein